MAGWDTQFRGVGDGFRLQRPRRTRSVMTPMAAGRRPGISRSRCTASLATCSSGFPEAARRVRGYHISTQFGHRILLSNKRANSCLGSRGQSRSTTWHASARVQRRRNLKNAFSCLAVFALVIGVTQATAAQGRGQARGRGQAQGREQRRVPGLIRTIGGITRDEWRGGDQSFKVHDWTATASSGNEAPGANRPDRQTNDEDYDARSRIRIQDWTVRGFNGIDHNRDNRITADEWHFDRESFRRADHNQDGVISRSEFLSEDAEQDDDREDRFTYLDVNRDNGISRPEWHGTRANFDMLDDNRDGVLTRVEVFGEQAPSDLFTSVDVNRNGMITRDEWHWSLGSFTRLDRNQDGRLTKEEFSGTVPVGTSGARSQAYQMGYDRGLVEGRAAGREDRERNQGWDLEGQRELEGLTPDTTRRWARPTVRQDRRFGLYAGIRPALKLLRER